jgi:hypothetical protein
LSGCVALVYNLIERLVFELGLQTPNQLINLTNFAPPFFLQGSAEEEQQKALRELAEMDDVDYQPTPRL